MWHDVLLAEEHLNVEGCKTSCEIHVNEFTHCFHKFHLDSSNKELGKEYKLV